ncbi:MAG: DUF1343 domain-containing protein [Acidobacteria bacterium]|nr:MAG: DUF1343 domain-containing protein [Acidobacteriota bacterium]
MAASVRLGSDVLLCSSRLEGARVGVVCNHASIDRGFLHVIDRVAMCEGVTLAAIFGPQHGFRSDVQDNMVETPHGDDPRRRVPIYSLYSETREPTAEMLRGIDALVIDLQDIGARIYTYIYTMANCMRAAAKHGVTVIVCDRPNPIGGIGVEGATLQHGWESFVGLFPIPMRHGMTTGELAKLFNDAFGIGASLDVVKMEGWTRDMYADATGLPWVMPSPNMPTLDTAIVYPGTVLFEGTMVSEGRGTTRPFELVGAPWIDAERFAEAMNKPVITGVALIDMFRRFDPSRFAWRQPPYEYEHDKMPIDILAGSDVLRKQVESGVAIGEIAASWADDEAEFLRLRSSYLLY